LLGSNDNLLLVLTTYWRREYGPQSAGPVHFLGRSWPL